MKDYPTYKAEPCCSVCKGECCKQMGCHYSPRDFDDLTFEGLKREIEKGKISIDWWEAKEPEYYLRARHIGADVVDPSWGGECVNLTPEGCSLSFEDRPLGGRAVKPDPTGECCKTSYSKKDCKDEWKPYREILVKLVRHFRR